MRKSSGICCFLLVLLPAVTAWGGGKQVTWFLDGAGVEQEVEVTSGTVDVLLPSGVQPGSIRVKALGSGRLARVDLMPVTPGRAEEKEAARLAERREELRDRLKALSVKEEIFKATAKAQGGKAPRRTRTNPEPLAAIRQGTDFAIARLEDVYAARRKAEREIQEVERRQFALQQRENVSGKVARIRLEGRKGVVRVSYLLTGTGWQPFYDIRVSGGTAEVTMSALIPRDAKPGTKVAAVRLSESPGVPAVALGAGNPPRVATWTFPATVQMRGTGAVSGITVTLRNDSGVPIHPGEAAVFVNEEYIGAVGLPGTAPGSALRIAVGGGADMPVTAVTE